MGKRNWIVIAALGTAAAGFGTATAAHTTVGVQIGVPVYPQAVYPRPVYTQPAPVVVYEPRPAPRTWVPGHWEWQGNAWGPHRSYVRGDLDRDGVPNRWDRAPRNPYRY